MKRLIILALIVLCFAVGRIDAQQARVLTVGSVQAATGSTFVLPVSLDHTDGALGIDLELAYDPAMLTAIGYAPGPAAAGYEILCNLAVTGTVWCVWYAPIAPANSGPILLLTFQSEEISGQTPVHVAHFALNEGWYPGTATDGYITILWPDLTPKRRLPGKLHLHLN